MAGFAQDRPADCRIRHPVVSGNPGRIDAALQYCRRASLRKLLFEIQVERGKPAIEADRQLTTAFVDGLSQLSTFVFSQRHWLLDKDVLTRLQSFESLARVILIPARNEDKM